MTPEPGSSPARTTGVQPYAPPTAPVADAHVAADRRSAVRPLRLLAIAGNVTFATAPLVGFYSGRSDTPFITVCLAFFAVGLVSVIALAARAHATWVGSFAIVANVVVSVFWAWILGAPPAVLSKGGAWVGVAYCVAACLNIVTLLVLRRTSQRAIAAVSPVQSVNP